MSVHSSIAASFIVGKHENYMYEADIRVPKIRGAFVSTPQKISNTFNGVAVKKQNDNIIRNNVNFSYLICSNNEDQAKVSSLMRVAQTRESDDSSQEDPELIGKWIYTSEDQLDAMSDITNSDCGQEELDDFDIQVVPFIPKAPSLAKFLEQEEVGNSIRVISPTYGISARDALKLSKTPLTVEATPISSPFPSQKTEFMEPDPVRVVKPKKKTGILPDIISAARNSSLGRIIFSSKK